MRFDFAYTGLRARDLDKAITFFTDVLGMALHSRVKAPWNKGEFANLTSRDGGHTLELSSYADDSPVAGPFREGDELDHLGFQVDDFDAALGRLKATGFAPALGPFHDQGWHIAFVPVIENLWLDVYHLDAKPRPHARRKAESHDERTRRSGRRPR